MNEKILFINNGVLYFKGKDVYSNNIPQNIWYRYLLHFKQLEIISIGSENQGEGINVSSIDNDRIKFFRFPALHEPLECRDLSSCLKLIKDKLDRVDAIIVRLPSILGYLFIREAKALNIPIAVEVVGSIWHEYIHKGSWLHKMLSPLRYIQMRKTVRRASHAIYVTRDFLQDIYPCEGFTAYASNVQIDEVNKQRVYKRHDVLRIVTVGHLDFYFKGQDVVLKALAIVNRNGHIPFRYYCVGDGSGAGIKKLVGKLGLDDRVCVIGSLERKALMSLLDDTDLYIQPSRTEGLPRALVEALSRGCPALASNVGGIPELLNVRYLHAPGDYQKLAEDIIRVGMSIEELECMSSSNKQMAAAFLSEELERRRNIFWKEFARFVSKKIN